MCIKITTEIMYDRCEKSGIKLIEGQEYKGYNGIMKFECEECHEVFERKLNNIFRNKICLCKKCGISKKNEKRKLTHEQFVERVKDVLGEEYEVIGKYTTMRNKVKMKHKTCGNEYEAYAGNVSKGATCLKCSDAEKGRKQLKKHEVFINEIKEMYGDEIEVISEYKGAFKEIIVKHKCGYSWETTPDALLSGKKCPKCKASKMEIETMKALKEMNLTYKHSVRLKEVYDKKTLEVDFMVYDENNKIKFAIECNGQQHYFPVELFGGKGQYNKQIKHDNMKAMYCVENNISLLVIPYWEMGNIKNILIEYVNK